MTYIPTGNRGRMLVHDDDISILWTTDLPTAAYPRFVSHMTLHFHGKQVFHRSPNSVGCCNKADPMMVH